MVEPATISMWKNTLKTILTKENYEKIKKENKPEVLKQLLYWYHYMFKRNKRLYNEAFPLLLRKMELEKIKEKLEKAIRLKKFKKLTEEIA